MILSKWAELKLKLIKLLLSPKLKLEKIGSRDGKRELKQN